jgi:transposase-like protein
VPKPSHLRSIDFVNTAPAAHDVAPRASGEAVETVPKAGRRRSFSAAEKLRIVREAAACTEYGAIEALQRREGIYSSQLCNWRKQLDLHGSEALETQKRGPKPKFDAKDLRIAELEKRNAKLEAKLAFNAQLLELQKKAAFILGIDLASNE